MESPVVTTTTTLTAVPFELAIAQLARASVLSGDEKLLLGVKAGQTSTVATGMNVVTTLVGAAVLGFPSKFAVGGWFIAPVVLITCAWAAIEMGYVIEAILQTCEARARGGERFTFGTRPDKFEDLMEVPFGRKGKILACFLSNTFLLLTCGAFVVLMGTSLEFVIQKAFWSPYHACVLAVGVLFVPLTLLDDMSIISKLSVIGVLASVVYVVAISAAGISTGLAAGDQHQTRYVPKSVEDIGSVVAVMLLCLSYQMVAPTLRSEMAVPEELPKAITGAVAVVVLVYGLTGSAGFYGWGTNARGNVLNNMFENKLEGGKVVYDEHGAVVKKPMLAGLALSSAIIANLFVTFPLFMSCVCRALEGNLLGGYSVPGRLGLFTLAFCIGFFCPYFNELLAIIGAVLGVSVGLFIPLASYWSLMPPSSWDRKQSLYVQVCKHTIIFVIGLVTLVAGTASGVEGMIARMSDPSGSRGYFEYTA